MEKGREKKDSKMVTIRMEKSLLESVNKMMESTGLSKTAIIERGTRKYVEQYEETGRL